MRHSIYRIAVAVLALSTAMIPVSHAATQSVTAPVSASISTSLTLTVNVFSVNPTTFAETASPNFAFGTLTRNAFGGMDAARYFKTYVSANSQGLPYTITQSGTAMSNGTVNLPANACVVTPAYDPANNGGAALVGTLGLAGSWVGNSTLYTSNSAGDLRTLAVYYSLLGRIGPGGAAYIVPDTQPAGNYTGTVIFTVTA